MRSLLLLLLTIPHLQAEETVLYDVDYSKSFSDVGKTIPVGSGSYPGRATCTSINAGTAIIGQMPDDVTSTAAILTPDYSGGALQARAQLQFGLDWSAYAFRKHRLEMKFSLAQPMSFSASNTLTIFTDGGVTTSLSFRGDSSTAKLSGNVTRINPPWGEQVVTEDTSAGTVYSFQPVHLIWEMDATSGSSSVQINGNTVSRSGLSVLAPGARNGIGIPGPVSIRISLTKSNTTPGIALQSFKLTGSDYDGPLYRYDPSELTDQPEDIVSVPFKIPDQGLWQPQFSMNGGPWVSFGAPANREFLPVERVIFGKKAAPQILFRMIPAP